MLEKKARVFCLVKFHEGGENIQGTDKVRLLPLELHFPRD